MQKFTMLQADRHRLQHMIDAALEAIAFTEGRIREDLETDRQLVLSLIKDIEIIGEAASQVTESARQHLAHVPWRHVISMRNRLVHGYFSVNLDIVWETVQDDLPKLLTDLERAMAAEQRKTVDTDIESTD